MQTFLPYRDFGLTARCLDNKRLGKQRVECLQIFNALRGLSKGWRHHPAVLMWSGYEVCLAHYMQAIIREWCARGFVNAIRLPETASAQWIWPDWWDDDRVFSSHRSNLLRKDPEYYGQFDWVEPTTMPYHWPVTKDSLALRKVLDFCP